jgi:hypothetical protein
MGFKPSASRVVLTTSYQIWVTAANGKRLQIGGIQSISPSASKDVLESYEIGNANGARIGEPFELIGGIVRSKTLEVSRLKFYSRNMLEAFGSAIGAQELYEQDTTFEIEEVLKIPAFKADGTPDSDDGKAVTKTMKIYKDCLIERLGSTRNIAGGDIRETETATIKYRTATSLAQ